MSEPVRSDSAWEEYLAAARRLDALRRGAFAVEDEPARAATATFEELTRVRARLAAQHTRLRTLGVPEEELAPSSAELAAVPPLRGDVVDGPDRRGESKGEGGPGADAAFATGGTGTIWAALRRCRSLADDADSALAPPRGPVGLLRRARTLLARPRRPAD